MILHATDIKSSRRKTKQFSSYFRFPTSHTTVRAVPHTYEFAMDHRVEEAFKVKVYYMSVRPPRIRALSFHLIPTSFTPTVPNSYRALVCVATLPTVICLV